MTWRASSFDHRFGANHHSSPTAVTIFLLISIFLRVWKTSAPILIASVTFLAHTGTIINSWISRLLSACDQPLMIFMSGIGNVLPSHKNSYSCFHCTFAIATHRAIDIPNIAFAHRFDLLGVPSRAIIASSNCAIVVYSFHTISWAKIVLTLCTALRTHFHRYLVLSPSLSSSASWTHVDAPDGTIARQVVESSVTSTSMVGFHLLSSTSLACTWVIFICPNR